MTTSSAISYTISYTISYKDIACYIVYDITCDIVYDILQEISHCVIVCDIACYIYHDIVCNGFIDCSFHPFYVSKGKEHVCSIQCIFGTITHRAIAVLHIKVARAANSSPSMLQK